MHIELQFKIKQISGYAEHSWTIKFITTLGTLKIQNLKAYTYPVSTLNSH